MTVKHEERQRFLASAYELVDCLEALDDGFEEDAQVNLACICIDECDDFLQRVDSFICHIRTPGNRA